MTWLDPSNIVASDSTPEEEDERAQDAFYRMFGNYGMCIIGIFLHIDPLKQGSFGEYAGYAIRLVTEARRHLSSEWEERPGLLQEIVRRSFHPSQVVPTASGFVFVSNESLEKLAEQLGVAIRDAGGWEKFFPVP